MKNLIYKILFIVLLAVQMTYAQGAKVFLNGLGITVETLVAPYATKGYIDIWNVGFSPSLNNDNPIPGVLTFTKYKSKNSPLFHNMIVTGADFAKMEIAFARIINNSGYQTYLNYKMENVYVVSIKDNNDFTETIEIVMKKVAMEYYPINLQTGQLGTVIKYGWGFDTRTPF
jgi:type VI protein secretion system component Hcp